MKMRRRTAALQKAVRVQEALNMAVKEIKKTGRVNLHPSQEQALQIGCVACQTCPFQTALT